MWSRILDKDPIQLGIQNHGFLNHVPTIFTTLLLTSHEPPGIPFLPPDPATPKTPTSAHRATQSEFAEPPPRDAAGSL